LQTKAAPSPGAIRTRSSAAACPAPLMSRDRSRQAEPRRKRRTHSPGSVLPHFVWLWFKDSQLELNYRQTWQCFKSLTNKLVPTNLSVDPLDKPKARREFAQSGCWFQGEREASRSRRRRVWDPGLEGECGGAGRPEKLLLTMKAAKRVEICRWRLDILFAINQLTF
jgi:hypothetical protein